MMMYKILPLLSISFLCMSLLSLNCMMRAGADPVDAEVLAGKRVLLVYGGWEGHSPEAFRDIYVPWLQNEGALVTTSNTLNIYADPVAMDSFDLIVQVWSLGTIEDAQLKGLLQAVENGAGFAGWHGGIVDAFRNAPDYHLMTGGQFLAHPGGQIHYTVNVTDHNDPVMEGIGDFDVFSEQYYLLTDPNIDVLASTQFTADHLPWLNGRTMPVIWKHQYGQGRVFVNTIGHNPDDHAIPEVALTMRRGMIWAADR